MLAEERRAKIQEFFKDRTTVVISELAEHFQTSEMTIRRDLRAMEERGVCQRIHGGAVGLRVLRYQDERYLRYLARVQSQVAEKAAIGRAAAGMVRPGELIAIDSGTTAVHLAYALREHGPLTVITNSVRVMEQLYDAEGITLIMPGGTISVEEPSRSGGEIHFVGPVAAATLRTLRPSKAFISTAGIIVQDGIFNVGLLQAEIRRLLIEIAEEVILITDHTKFGRNAGFFVATTSVIDKVITDSAVPPQDLERLRAMGIEVVLVEPTRDVMHLHRSFFSNGEVTLHDGV